jgi:hypothetical protein
MKPASNCWQYVTNQTQNTAFQKKQIVFGSPIAHLSPVEYFHASIFLSHQESGRWQAVVDLSDHLLKAPKLAGMLGSLASLGGAVNPLLPDAVFRVRLWLLVALARLKRFDRLERELAQLGLETT